MSRDTQDPAVVRGTYSYNDTRLLSICVICRTHSFAAARSSSRHTYILRVRSELRLMTYKPRIPVSVCDLSLPNQGEMYQAAQDRPGVTFRRIQIAASYVQTSAVCCCCCDTVWVDRRRNTLRGQRLNIQYHQVRVTRSREKTTHRNMWQGVMPYVGRKWPQKCQTCKSICGDHIKPRRKDTEENRKKKNTKKLRSTCQKEAQEKKNRRKKTYFSPNKIKLKKFAGGPGGGAYTRNNGSNAYTGTR